MALHPAISGDIARALNVRALDLILMPTEQCNFRCTYCYEDFKLGGMPPSVVAGLKNLLKARAPELDELTIAWFGGEPLLAKKLILDLSQFVHELQHANPALQYSASMATNAYLLDRDMLTELVAYGVRSFQITLDGPREAHDRTRVTRTGRGSFDRIWANLLAIRDSDFDVGVTIRLHYQAHTHADLTSLIEMLNEEIGGDTRFRVHFKAVARLGGPNDRSIRTVPANEQRELERKLAARLRFPDQAVNLDGYVCYAGAANSLVVRSNGDLNKCTVALSSNANRIGQLNPDGSITVEQDKYRRWVDALLSGDPENVGCPLHHVLEGYNSAQSSTPVRAQAIDAPT